jgi:hypothetical protein
MRQGWEEALSSRWDKGMLFAIFLSGISVISGMAQAKDPDSATCSSHAVVNGIRHQPTTAEMEMAESLCGISDPVDTAPTIGAVIDGLSRELLEQSQRN